MFHKQLITHVTIRQQQGATHDQIRDELLADGWAEKDIAKAFYYAANPDKLHTFSLWRAFHSQVPSSITLLLLFSTVILAAASFFMFEKRTLSYTINLPSASPGMERIEFSYGEQPSLSNPDFFGKVKQQFIADRANFIEADLTSLVLRVYKDGEMSLEVPIETKGREGSWWETPAGLYKINNKEKEHFSGMGHVWMPWSMNFQGNFYIHGRTYYPDGTLTSSAYTGGCIRLSTENAEKVYNAIEVGTPILVFEHSFASDSFTYKQSEIKDFSAPIYLAADLKNNHVFAQKESEKQVPIASITKLMTALIATEYINLDAKTTISQSSIVYTSKPRLKVGEEYSIYQLLFPLLMESSNESAEAIARFYGRTNFIKRMNDKAASIGMLNTKFADPSGASEENISTTEDLFMLAKYIYNNRSFIFNITSGKIKNSAYGTSGFANLGNFNDFVDYSNFFGGKNGQTTAAQETSLSVFEFPVGETKRPVAIIVLGSPLVRPDAAKLVDYTTNLIK